MHPQYSISVRTCHTDGDFPKRSEYPYLGESDDQDGYSAVLKSTDSGATWSAAWDWFNALRGNVMVPAADLSYAAIIYAGIDDGTAALGAFQGLDSSGLFRSTDGGASWTKIGFPTSAVNLIAIDPANPQILYAGAEGHYTPASRFSGCVQERRRRQKLAGYQQWAVRFDRSPLDEFDCAHN